VYKLQNLVGFDQSTRLFYLHNEKNMRILLLGLGSILTNAMDCRLRKYGCRVVKANDSHEALSRIHAGQVDILVTSIDVSNFQLTHFIGLIRENLNKDLPIILVTEPDADADTVLEGIEAGADDFVTFPFKPAELILRIKLLLHRFVTY
jgi:DNA-binding response OmpR family regulator